MKHKNQHPLISIIIVNYNGKQYLERSIPAVLDLTYPNYEVIVVDNKSTDGSTAYVKKQKGIKLIKNPVVGGKNHGCNLAAKMAQGAYLLFIDNDLCINDIDLLQKLLSSYTDDIGIISVALFNEGENTTKGYGNFLSFIFTNEKTQLSLAEVRKKHNTEVAFPSGQIFFTSKTKWHQIGGYDEFFTFGGDDSDVGIRMWHMGYRNILFSETLQMHIGMAERTNTKKYSDKWRQVCFAHMVVIFKNYALNNMLITLPCYTFFSLLKSFKQSLFRQDIRPLLSYIQACIQFIIKFPQILIKRKKTQELRVIKDDIFLNVR